MATESNRWQWTDFMSCFQADRWAEKMLARCCKNHKRKIRKPKKKIDQDEKGDLVESKLI